MPVVWHTNLITEQLLSLTTATESDDIKEPIGVEWSCSCNDLRLPIDGEWMVDDWVPMNQVQSNTAVTLAYMAIGMRKGTYSDEQVVKILREAENLRWRRWHRSDGGANDLRLAEAFRHDD